MNVATCDSSVKNSFGYYDPNSKEIVLKRPCSKKSDWEEALVWFDAALLNGLDKFSIGIGAVESFVADDSRDGMYLSAREIIKQTVDKSKYSDNEMLNKILSKLKGYKELKNIGLKCFSFSDDEALFELFISVVKNQDSLVYLDLTGCYFNNVQLGILAEVVANSYIAHLVWPEPRVGGDLLNKILVSFEKSMSLVIVRGAPEEIVNIAKKNRDILFGLIKRPVLINENDIARLKKYKNSVRLAIGYEKQKIREMEKTLEGILV